MSLPSNNRYIGLDFETYGAVDLVRHGLSRYINDPSFTALIGSTYQMQHGWHVPARQRFEFINEDRQDHIELLRQQIGEHLIVAHNAPFEQAVLGTLGLHYPSEKFIDSAVVARAAGAAGKLEAAAPQLLDFDKMEAGKNLIKLFSIPGKLQEEQGIRDFDPQIIETCRLEWNTFGDYCDLDAELGFNIAVLFKDYLTPQEYAYNTITMDMNNLGWPVDVGRVEEMQRRYLENQDQALTEFRDNYGAHALNLNSLKQMKEWCADRGIRTSSFAEDKVTKLLARIEQKLSTMSMEDPKFENYVQVCELLRTKRTLGGSSLKKLAVILDTVGSDDRLRDQYLHCGAGQSLRTTGRSVQMQNLKRLSTVGVMEELDDPAIDWDNEKLAENMRQSFTSSRKDGALIVGDFASVEARGLAWQAGADWKVRAFHDGQDMYKVLAGIIYSVPYDNVTKTQRQTGKVGELACGYGAGGPAVQAFAEGMGVDMTEAESSKLVSDWRDANPEIVEYWDMLDGMLHQVVEDPSITSRYFNLPDGFLLEITTTPTPVSLGRIHPQAQSIQVKITESRGDVFMRRYFHGCYTRGRNICYYRPSDRKTGEVWKRDFVDPKTKQRRFYELYGGKMAGILTQSFCRELFFQSLAKMHARVKEHGNLNLVGQFHDEIVLDWWPMTASISRREAMDLLQQKMSDPGKAKTFPLAAEIKFDYRYTK